MKVKQVATTLQVAKSKSKVVSVGLSTKQREMLEVVAAKKYRIPQNLSHTIRLLIEDAYASL